jgi:eukaryotic-like serine/threonine-protein kinase
MVVDGSLATAVSKLRKAMGDEEHPVIVTVPRVGYRLAAPVYCKAVAAPADAELGFKAGDPVPGREQWRFSRPSPQRRTLPETHPRIPAIRAG